MHSVHAGMWDPRPPSKHASPLPPSPQSNVRLAHVTTAAPAKRITFYKSGDNQFGGVRMAVHKRSFKCFDALLDDLSQKMPLPFGVRTVTTPRGTHTIKHLEQLQDGGCYLCSDRRHAKPVNMELASKRPTIWYHYSQRPHRPESSSATPPGHLPYRQRRILLVKNSEPGMRRSVVLNRRSTRSLRAFLDEVSEVMQFHVRKLYTVEGRRIDSVQSLMTCPGVLVCVGRESFSPLLVNFIRKSSEEKLPGLGSRSPGLGPRTPGNGARSPATQGARSPPHGAQSRGSEYSESHESKKNVNFGLETKKSIIHPRSDSSNRSARFSLSSEKSYGNGVSTFPQGRPAISNEDIEKRVLVNKDGSLSVEMRVRFRLHNEETVQWSTQIKKSPSLTNECCPLDQAQPHYLQQGHSESCSDPDSTSFDPEVVEYSSRPLQRVAVEGHHCPCCYQRPEQQYDLWENPAHSHKHPPVPPPHTSGHTHTMMRHTHSSSSSSSCNSRRVVRCRARLSNCGGGSGSEQSQLVQEEMCVTEQVEHRVEMEQDGDTHVEVHRVSRCCSRSEVVAMDNNLRPLSQKSVEDELMMEDEGERPLSAVSSSSHVLQSLKEDQDDDLPPSVSRCSHKNEQSPTSEIHLNDEPTRNISAGSVRSAVNNKQKDGEETGNRAVSAASSCHCGAATPHSMVEAEEVDQAPSAEPRISRASCSSSKAKIQSLEEEGAADDEDEETNRVVSGLSGHSGLSAGSVQSRVSSVCPHCGGCKRGASSVSNSRASQRSHRSHPASPKPTTPLSSKDKANNSADEDDSEDSAVSTQSNKSNLTNYGRISATSNVLEGRACSVMSTTSNLGAAEKEEERPPSAASAKSHRSSRSQRSGCNGSTGFAGDKEEERNPSAMSGQSNLSAKSRQSHKSNCKSSADAADIEGENVVERPSSTLSAKSGVSSKTSPSVKLSIMNASPTDNTAAEEDDTNTKSPSDQDKPGQAERPESVLSAKSAKSNVSAKSGRSRRSTCSHCAGAVSPGAKSADGPVIEASEQEEESKAEERAESAMSAKSGLSAKSNKSLKSVKASERSHSPKSETGGDLEKRAVSQTSGRSAKSNVSVKSSKSCKSGYNGNKNTASPDLRGAEENENEMLEEETQQRAESAMENRARAASAGSTKSKNSNCNEKVEAGSEIGDNIEEGEKAEDRAASALSNKSASSAKSSKSQMSNRNTESPNPNKCDVSTPETNEAEKKNQERVASSLSVKSKSSVKSSTSHKSNCSKHPKSVSPSPNVVTIKTPEMGDEEGNETTERTPSAASVKSGKSNASSALSRKSNRNHAAEIAVTEAADAGEKTVEDNASRSKSSEPSHGQMLSPKRTRTPRTHSPKAPAASPSGTPSSVQQLVPGPGVGETRGSSALSVHSRSSAKSGRSKCCCGATLPKKEKEENSEEKKEDNEVVKNEEASERSASVLSSSSKRRRRESEGTEQPLSRNSSGSVSLGLPEDQDSDSGKSSVSFHINTENKDKVKEATPDVSSEQSAIKEEVERAGSTVSQKSNSDCRKSTLSPNPLAVDIPTIETPGQSEDKGEEGGDQTVRVPSASSSAKSSRSHKSSCNCKVKAAAQMVDINPEEQRAKTGNDLETESVKSASTTKASKTDAPKNRSSSKMSSKSAAGSSIKNANVTHEESANIDSENQASRPASEAKGKDTADNEVASVHSKRSCCLRPDSAASAHSDTLNPGHKVKSKKETSVKSSSPCPLHSSRPRSKAETCSESTLSHSLSAADLLKETMAAAAAATRPHSRQSKASRTSDKARSEKSGRCHSRNNQTDQQELELTPACLPNTSPNEVVSDWLRSIPADSSMLAVGDELHEEEAEQEKMEEEKVEKVEESPEDEKADEEEKVEAEEKEEKEDEGECHAEEEEKDSDPTEGPAEEAPRTNPQLLSVDSLPRNLHSSASVMKVLLSSSLGRCQSMPEVSPVYGRRLSTSARGLLDCLAQLQLIEPAVNPDGNQQKDRHQRYEDIMAILQSLWLTEPRDIIAMETKDVGREQVTPPRSSSGVDMSSGSGGSGKENGNEDGEEAKQNKTNKAESLHEDQVTEMVVEEEEKENEETETKGTEAEPEETPTEQAKTDVAEEPEQNEEQSTTSPSLGSPKANENPSSSDKSSANDSSKSPTDNERETLEDSSSGTPPTVVRAPLSKKPSQDPDPVWIMHLLKKLEKQFMNHYVTAMAEFKVRWDLDDSLILDTMISELRDEVSRRIQSSIDREMRKIQSRAGRAGRSPRPPQRGNLSRESTMTEKRRRMLKVMKNQSVKTADSLSDGEMTGEFSDQRSDDEYCPCDACVRKKMAARPLKKNPLAAEAPVMMEFDLLKILQLKKNPSPAAVPPVPPVPPVEEEGDSMVVDDEGRNLEVLQEEEEEDETKEDIKAHVVLEETIPEEDEEIEEDGVEAEEEEKDKEENSAGDEEEEEEETGGEEAGEEETAGEEAGEEDTAGEEAGEEETAGEEAGGEETAGEEAGEEEKSENGEEEEEEAQCQCHSAKNEEDSDKAEDGEGETPEEEDAEETSDNSGDKAADEEETTGEEEGESAEDKEETEGNEEEAGASEEEGKSDRETVKEATAAEGETTENGEGEEEEENAEGEECEVSEFKPEEDEEEETTGRESGEEEASGETEDDKSTKNANEESTAVEDFVEGNVSTSADAEDEDEGDNSTGERESHEDSRGASEEQEKDEQGQGVTEGEEADAEDSDSDNKRPSDTSADESGREGAGTTGDEEEKETKEDGGEGDAVEELKPEEEEEQEEEGEVKRNKGEDGALLHQFTKTSVESQPGSLEDINTESPHNLVTSIEVPKITARVHTGGGAGQKRSRSPGRVQRRKPKECDVELDDF